MEKTMDRIYKIGGHCFALPDERLMEAVDGISGFKPFVWQPDLVSAKDVYEGAWLPDFTVWEGNGWGFPAFQRKSYGFGYEDVTGTFGVSGDSFLLELAPQGEPSLYLRTMGGTGRGICLYGNYSPRLLRFALWMGYDLIVFDIQDVGARFYTYISTMQYVMEACAENRKQLVITDRPNPCDYVDGPVRQKNQKSFVGMHAIPILHGCTVGELAQMINGEGWLPNGKKCALTVIPVEGWKHGQPYSLPVKPSPNLPNDQAIALYPSLCPFEGTAISVGRGTLYPFQVIGSPDIRISSFSFRPEALEGFDKNPMYKNQYCYGNNLRHITAPKGFSLKYIITYYQAYQDLGKADKFFTRPQWFDLLIGNRTVREQIMKGASEEEIRAGWQNELEAYKKMREKYLLYE
jgi:uncharacterized protein YbbC (DUF1343 family)